MRIVLNTPSAWKSHMWPEMAVGECICQIRALAHFCIINCVLGISLEIPHKMSYQQKLLFFFSRPLVWIRHNISFTGLHHSFFPFLPTIKEVSPGKLFWDRKFCSSPQVHTEIWVPPISTVKGTDLRGPTSGVKELKGCFMFKIFRYIHSLKFSHLCH